MQIVVDSDVKWSKTKIANPQHRITQVIIDLVEKHSLPKDLIDAATLKYEKVGDVLMVPQVPHVFFRNLFNVFFRTHS